MKTVKGLIVFHDQMEDGEAVFSKALLVRAGMNMTSVSMSGKKEIITAYGQSVLSDLLYEEVQLNEYDFLVIPGGKYVSFTLGKNEYIDQLIADFYRHDKYIAALCAAPAFLGRLGFLKDKRYTSYPETQKDDYKGIYEGLSKAVIDGKIITGKSAGAIVEFVSLIVETLLGLEAKNRLLESIKF